MNRAPLDNIKRILGSSPEVVDTSMRLLFSETASEVIRSSAKRARVGRRRHGAPTQRPTAARLSGARNGTRCLPSEHHGNFTERGSRPGAIESRVVAPLKRGEWRDGSMAENGVQATTAKVVTRNETRCRARNRRSRRVSLASSLH
jgi:hypothetical protein